MKCSQCGFLNDPDAAFCAQCGQPLNLTCPNCGSPLKPGDKFCKKCGTRLSLPQASPQSQPPSPSLRSRLPAASPDLEGQRKPVTILFTDIVGSTSLAEKLDPEEWKEIVNGAHQRVSQAVYRYEGTIAQLLGDGVLAFFGAPVTHEDDPLRAARAALDIQKSIGEYEHELQGYLESFQMRIGLNTGTVVVGQVGGDQHMEYLAVGDAVNLAARLQSAAQPGGILLSESTARLVKASFDLQPLGPLQLKGKAEPISAFELLHPKEVPESPRGFKELHSPLVGRDAELAHLMDRLAALEKGNGQIVAVVGEAGIGKSRLVEEARSRSQSQLRWLEGRALSYGQGLSFWTITQLLYSDLGLSDGDPEARVRVALKRRVKDLFGEGAPAVLPYLYHLAGVKLEGDQVAEVQALDGETLKRQVLITLTRYFAQVAQQQPLILVFEDLHWADPSSLEALDYLLASTDRCPLMLLLLTRYERESPSWRVKIKAETDYPHRFSEIQLKPLSGEDQNQLVDNLLALAELPAPVRQLILDRAEGNPFYLEEVVRSLIDQGAIVHAGGSWRPAGNIESLSIPTTLQGVLLARIDRLQEDVRHTLQLASVIGKTFLYKLLQAIAEAEQQLDRHLALLQRADLVREKARLPELEYIFKHSLTQEAAYNSLLLERRREFHQRVGEALEHLFTGRQDQYLGLLAHHFEAAGDLPKAVDYLTKAGDQARLSDEHAEAIGFYQRALMLLSSPEDGARAAQVWLKLGLIYNANFQFDLSHQAYETAFQLQQKHPLLIPAIDSSQWQTFRTYVGDTMNTLDPGIVKWEAEAEITHILFSGLARLNPDMDVIPEVARSWQVLDGGRKYIFHLRDDFHWSDGSPVTAQDFEYAWKRNLDPATRSETVTVFYDIVGAREYHEGVNPDPGSVGVHALDPLTLEVNLADPVAYFPFLVTVPESFPLPKAAIDRFGADWWKPGRILSNGPFHLLEYDAELGCSAERNSGYPLPVNGNIGRIEWLVLPDTKQRLQAYLENRVDFTVVEPALLEGDQLKEQRLPPPRFLHTSYLVFDRTRPPFNDLRVRKAFMQSINPQIFPEEYGVAIAQGGFVPPGMPGHSPGIGLPYNPEIARSLLSEAGYPGGQGFPSLTAVCPHGFARYFAPEFQRQWRENLGVEIDFQDVGMWQVADFTEKRISGSLVVSGWIADYPDPDNFLRQSVAVNFPNFLGTLDPAYTHLVDEAARTSDRAKRLAMYRQADRWLVQEQALVFPLAYAQRHLYGLLKPWVEHLVYSRLGGLRYQDILLAPH